MTSHTTVRFHDGAFRTEAEIAERKAAAGPEEKAPAHYPVNRPGFTGG
jgi:hypothetical protein